MGAAMSIKATMLWQAKDFLPLSYSRSARDEHVEYENDEQFEPEARRLVQRAAAEIENVRSAYTSLADWLPVIEANASAMGGWSTLDAGIANVLRGDTDRGHLWLAAWIAELEADIADGGEFEGEDWRLAAHQHAREFVTALETPAGFKQIVIRNIETARAGQRLAPIQEHQLDTLTGAESRPPSPPTVIGWPPKF
jgi:hypothetical protein